jgi:hypothetical protein
VQIRHAEYYNEGCPHAASERHRHVTLSGAEGAVEGSFGTSPSDSSLRSE